MGWGRYLLLRDIGQQFDLQDHEAAIEQQREELNRQRLSDAIEDGQIKALQRENDELRLYLTALIRLLLSKNMITSDELKVLVEAIDGLDGEADGRYEGELG